MRVVHFLPERERERERGAELLWIDFPCGFSAWKSARELERRIMAFEPGDRVEHREEWREDPVLQRGQVTIKPSKVTCLGCLVAAASEEDP